MTTTITPYDRLTAPVYPSVEALRMYEGPSTTRRYAFVDGVGLFRWYLGDTTTHNNTDVLEPSGGSVGRWILSVAFGGVPRSKPSVDVVATSNITLSGLQTVDGVSLTAGMVVLAARQTSKATRRAYVVASGTWTAATWFDSSAEAVLGSDIYVRRGTSYAGTTWALTSPTTGTVTLGTTELEWSPIMPLLVEGAVGFFSSGNSGDDADRLETLMNASRTIVLHGTITVDRPVVATTGGWALIGASSLPATIKQDTTWSGTGNDDEDNAFIRLQETESATAATTPSDAKTPMGSPTLNVTSATGFAAGGYFKALGISSTNDYQGQSAGANCPAEELLKVESVNSNTITHALPQTRWIGQNNATAPHKTIKLLTACVDGATIENIRFDAYQDGAAHATRPVVACAIAGTFARGVKINKCAFKGFVFSAIWARGCREWSGHELEFQGANNSRLYLHSCQNFRFTECHDRLDVLERHNSRDSALARYAWVFKSQCHAIKIQGSIRYACAGILAWAGDHCEIDATVEDIDFSSLHSVPIEEDVNIGRRGYVLDTNANDVPTAEFGRCNRYNVRWTRCHSGVGKYHSSLSDAINYWYAAVYLHDVFDSTYNLRNEDFGSDPETATQWRQLGVVCQDISGTLDAELQGFVKGVACIGTYNLLRQPSRLVFDAAAGTGNTGLNITAREAALLLDEGSGGLPQFEFIRCARTYHAVEIYSAFAFPSSGYKRVLVARMDSAVLYESGVYEARDVVIGRLANSAVYPGVCVALPIDDASASDSQIRVTTAPAAAPSTGVFITLSINTTAAGGTIRPMIGVLGGLNAVCPIYGATGQTFGARTYVESNNLGQAIPATNGADTLATLARIIGRARYKRDTSGGAGFMQLG